MQRRKNLAEIKRLLQNRKEAENSHEVLAQISQKSSENVQTSSDSEESKSRHPKGQFSPRICEKSGLARFLISKGVARGIAEEIAEDFWQNGRKLGSLKQSLVKRIQIAGELSFPRRVALVGPTGVGKSTILLKIADFYRKQAKNVSIVALDLEKGGAFAQLERYTSQWDMPLYESLESAEGDLILIDTTGCNFYQPNRVDQLGEQLVACGEVEILLTLSAAAKEVDLYGAIHQFSPLCPTSLAFTKLDETLASGVLINVSSKTDIPIRYIAYGYPLPGEIQLADAQEITHKILTDFNQEEFHYLRQLTN